MIKKKQSVNPPRGEGWQLPPPPPLSKVRSGEKKVQSERGGGCTLDKAVPWARIPFLTQKADAFGAHIFPLISYKNRGVNSVVQMASLGRGGVIFGGNPREAVGKCTI